MYVNYIFYFLQAFVLYVDIVVVADGIDADYCDILKLIQQSLDQVAADKAGCSCHQNGFFVQIYIILKHIVGYYIKEVKELRS